MLAGLDDPPLVRRSAFRGNTLIGCTCKAFSVPPLLSPLIAHQVPTQVLTFHHPSGVIIHSVQRLTTEQSIVQPGHPPCSPLGRKGQALDDCSHSKPPLSTTHGTSTIEIRISALDVPLVGSEAASLLVMDPASVAAEVAETIQAGHIRHHPDIYVDGAPSTAADQKERVTVESPHLGDDDLLHDLEDEDDIPYSVLRPVPKTHSNLPPLPDLRFEQSYLRSIAKADTWWKVMLVTARDQVRPILSLPHFVKSKATWPRPIGSLTWTPSDHDAPGPRYRLQLVDMRLAALESKCKTARKHRRLPFPQMVVWRKQLVDTQTK